MIVLTPTDSIQIAIISGSPSAFPQCVAAWRDITQTPTYVAGRSTATLSASATTLIAAPAANTQRVIDFLSICSRGPTVLDVEIRMVVSGANFIIWRGVIGGRERIEYENGKGFTVLTEGGLIKTLQSVSLTTVANDMNIATLASDVINDNATANTMQDVTGLLFPVVAGEMYWFRFDILYEAAATTTGSRWSIGGPASPTRLVYGSEYSLAAATTTRNANVIDYDLPAAANASSGSATSNRAVIEGVIQPSSSGDVIARFASEVANSAITAKAGSRVLWQRTL